MEKHYMVVVGDGESSRANVEVLLEDYLYKVGQDAVLVLAYEKKPSQAQVFAAQFLKEKDKEIIIFCPDSASYEGIPSSSVIPSDTPYQAVCNKLKGEDLVLLALPSDEDPDFNKVLGIFHKAKVNMFDLTEGLYPIKYDPKAEEEKPAPDMPQIEMQVKPDPKSKVEEEEDEEDFYLDEEDDEEESEYEEDDALSDEVYFGLKSLIKLIAREVVAELKNADEKPSKGSKK